MEITTEEVSRVHREDFYGALKKNDLEKLSQVYSDDYMLVRPDGSAFSKEQILEDLRAHSMSFESIELTNEKIRIYGSVGILTGDSAITTVRDGQRSKTEFRLVAVYCRQSDRLELIHFQSSPLIYKETKMKSKINVVLVHGAWADGSSWGKVIPLLDKKGLNVTAVQLPLTSLDDDIAVTRNALAAQKGPTIVVGHSYGGVVISGAANDVPNVKALVYIAAFGLDEGESIEGLSKQGPAPAGAGQIRPDEHGFLWIDRDGFAQAFAGDADPAEARIMAVTQKPLSIKSFTAKSGPPAWRHIRSWYLVSSNDQMIPPQAEEMMAKRMGATVRTVAASHASMISHPQEVADIIGAAAEAGVAEAVAMK